ncbi:MAG TPA: nucleotidyltransferase family protein [Bacteroidetes bacterium]|nr:nucleotidyltransferase family protein [Bacteroidota bacterium]
MGNQENIRGMILAAGMGTRLGRHARHQPKALLQVGRYTLLEQAVKKLISHGITRIVVNVHHHAQQVREYIDRQNRFGIDLEISGEEDRLLDTGGGIFRAAPFLSRAQCCVVYNVDVVSNIDLHRMIDRHRTSGALATLAVRERNASRYLLFDESGRLRAWKNAGTGETRGDVSGNGHLVPLAFSGIHVLSSEIFKLYEATTPSFPIIPVYLELARNHRVMAYPHNGDVWMDVGKPERIEEAGNWLNENMKN